MDELKSISGCQDVSSSPPIFCFSSNRSTNLILEKVILFCFSVLHTFLNIKFGSLVTKLPQTLLSVIHPICYFSLSYRSPEPRAKIVLGP